ncbi:hypothetical protein LCGC14_2539730, partial [marine sediment metagenome]
SDTVDATKLGIEALKARKAWEDQVPDWKIILLPGETKEKGGGNSSPTR